MQENRGRRIIDNTTSSGRGNFTRLGTVRHYDRCNGKYSPRVDKSICMEKMYSGKNTAISYTTECNLRVVNLVHSEEHILVLILGDIKFCRSRSRSISLSCTFDWGCYHLIDFFFHISKQGQFFYLMG